MAKRSRRKRGRFSWLLFVAVALLIAGFMARRLMMPGAARQLTHSAPDYSAASPQNDDAPGAHDNDRAPREHLSDTDRRALDEVIRRKTEGH
jgi:hypothetical protein